MPDDLREAHAHIAQHGRAMEMVHLDGCASTDECLQRIAAAAIRMRDQRRPGWLLAHGARVESWSNPVWPTAVQLDQATADRPCCVRSFDHHALAANSAALRAAGVSSATPDPTNGRIIRDDHNHPTGVLLEAAARLVWDAIPDDPPLGKRRQIRAALADLASHGFTEVHELLSPPWLGPLLAKLEDADELSQSIWLYTPLPDLERTAASRMNWERPGIRLAGAKVFADGTLNSRTASMLAPFADPLPGLPRGQAMMTTAELAAAIDHTARHGIGLAVHAIGDAAVRTTLDAYESVRPRLQRAPGYARSTGAPDTINGVPALRIEHAELIDEADIPRFAQLGVVCSVQPCHLLADIEALRRGLPHRLDRVLPLKDLIAAGCRPGELLWFGSDVPIVRPHPGDSIQAAVHRRRAENPSSAAIAPEQAISEADAWTAFAAGA